MEDEYRLLASRFVDDPYVRDQDKVRIKRVIYQLSLDDETSPVHQNDRWATQQRMEAMAMYLVTTYCGVANIANADFEVAKAEERLNLPERDSETNRKYNREDREALIEASTDVRELANKSMRCELLFKDIKKLEARIFARCDKLTDISVNVRRQEEVDERSN